MRGMRWMISALLVTTFSIQPIQAATDYSAILCDRSAGAEKRMIEVQASASVSCAQALQHEPDSARFKYQYARGLHKQAMEQEKKASEYLQAGQKPRPDYQRHLSAEYANKHQGYQGLIQKSYTEAVKWYRQAAEQGYPPAQNALGEQYVQGLGAPDQRVLDPDPAEAARWFHRAADQGYAPAKNNIGLLYLHGFGVDRNLTTAVEWFRKAEAQGNADAMFNLGQVYLEGQTAEADPAQAAEWFRKAAQANHPSAGTILGILYETGRGVPQDYQEAINWYSKPVNYWNDPVAQNNMAVLFLKGVDERGRGRDDAMDLLTKAAAAGYAPAEKNLEQLQGPALSPQLLVGAAIFTAIIAAGIAGGNGDTTSVSEEDYNLRQMREDAEKRWTCSMYWGGNPFKPSNCY